MKNLVILVYAGDFGEFCETGDSDDSCESGDSSESCYLGESGDFIYKVFRVIRVNKLILI